MRMIQRFPGMLYCFMTQLMRMPVNFTTLIASQHFNAGIPTILTAERSYIDASPAIKDQTCHQYNK